MDGRILHPFSINCQEGTTEEWNFKPWVAFQKIRSDFLNDPEINEINVFRGFAGISSVDCENHKMHQKRY